MLCVMTQDGRSRPLFSRLYPRASRRMEEEGMATLREELLSGLAGEVLEVGAGDGMNLAHYPPAVARVVAVEPEPRLRGLAERAARRASVAATVVPGTAESLPLPDRSVDAAVLCLVLCSVDDRRAALSELRRVLRHGGEVRFLEHGRAETPGLRMVQRAVDATLWPLLAGGCRTATDPVGDIAAAGFDVTAVRSLRFPDVRVPLPTTPHVLGAASA